MASGSPIHIHTKAPASLTGYAGIWAVLGIIVWVGALVQFPDLSNSIP